MGALTAKGHKLICYLSSGTAENWRPDFKEFEKYASIVFSAPMKSWPGEWWLRIWDPSALAIIKPIMAARMRLGAAKGCVAFEPDNVDCYSDHTCRGDVDKGKVKAAQLAYNRWTVAYANSLGMAVGLKNVIGTVVIGTVDDSHDIYDFAVNEQCLQYDECRGLLPFLHNNKAVFHVEYHGSVADVCSMPTKKMGSNEFSTKVALDSGLW